MKNDNLLNTKKKIKEEEKRTTYSKCDITKTVLGKCIFIRTYIENQEITQIINLT